MLMCFKTITANCEDRSTEIEALKTNFNLGFLIGLIICVISISYWFLLCETLNVPSKSECL